MNNDELEKYKNYVREKLSGLTPVFARASIGDYSEEVQIPDVNDEFNELYTGIEIMLEVIKTQLAELRESESHYQHILDSSLDGIVVEDNELIVYANKSFAGIFGYDNPKEVTGMEASRFRAPEDNERMSDYGIRRLSEKEVPSIYRFNGIHKNGSILELEAAVATWSLPGKNGIVTVVRDITETKRTGEMLRESEERYRIVAETAGDAIITIDEESKMIFVNQAANEIFGYTTEEMLNQPLTMLMPENLKKVHKDSFMKYMVTGNKRLSWKNIQLPGQHKSGKIIPLEISFGEFSGQGKRIFTGIVRDISERKIAEESIKKSLLEKEMLLQEIHHRVKNNLQVAASLLSMQSQYVKHEGTLRMIEDSQNRIKTMALVHENFYKSKDLSRIAFGDQIRQMVIHLFNIFGINENNIKFKLDTEDIYIDIDRAVPCGLLINELISNSLKHAFPNGRKGEISISLLTTDNEGISLVVNDNGIGLPEEVELSSANTMGMRVINTLCNQLDAKVEIDRTAGTKFIIDMSGKKYKERVTL